MTNVAVGIRRPFGSGRSRSSEPKAYPRPGTPPARCGRAAGGSWCASPPAGRDTPGRPDPVLVVSEPDSGSRNIGHPSSRCCSASSTKSDSTPVQLSPYPARASAARAPRRSHRRCSRSTEVPPSSAVKRDLDLGGRAVGRVGCHARTNREAGPTPRIVPQSPPCRPTSPRRRGRPRAPRRRRPSLSPALVSSAVEYASSGHHDPSRGEQVEGLLGGTLHVTLCADRLDHGIPWLLPVRLVGGGLERAERRRSRSSRGTCGARRDPSGPPGTDAASRPCAR